MRSPVVAMLWENWRLTRVEAAWRFTLGTVASLAVLAGFTAFAPRARDTGATIALVIIVGSQYLLWLSIAKLKGGRLIEAYQAGFPLHLLYTQPVRTAVLVGVPMAFQAALAVALYLTSALVLRLSSDYAFPLLPVAAYIAANQLAQAAGDWATRSRIVQWTATGVPPTHLLLLIMNRGKRWPAQFDFSLADYGLMAAIGLASFGVAVAGVARQRRGDTFAAAPRTAGSAGYPDWLITLFRFPCPTSSATRAQLWFDLKSSGLPILAVGLALAMLNLLLFAISIPVERLSDYAFLCAVLSGPVVLILGGNAFGIRRKQGRTYVSAFAATQPLDAARLAGLKVFLRTACVLAALIAVGVSVWASTSLVSAWGGFDGKDMGQELLQTRRAIGNAIGGRAWYVYAAPAIVASMAIALMVAVRAVFTALRARYSRRVYVTVSLLLLYALALVLLTLNVERGPGMETLLGILRVTRWAVVVAMGIATVYLFLMATKERLLTSRHVCVALLVSAIFAAAWVTMLRTSGELHAGLSASNMFWMLSPTLLPLTVSVLAPWSLSRIRHT